MSMIRRVAREPLVHFLLIGVTLFLLSSWFSDDDAPRDDLIRVTTADVDRLRSLWVVQYKRPPTEIELNGAIDAHIREEILNREAKRAGLDRDDVIIRRRLAQKMEFLVEDFATAAPPTEEQLTAYYEENADDYRRPPAVSFSHHFLNTDERSIDAASQAAERLRDQLNRGMSPDDAQLHSDPFVLPHDYEDLSSTKVEELFGRRDFVDAMFAVEPGSWHGPVRSAYGIHVVYVHARTEAQQPSLSEVRDRVQTDLVSERRRAALEAFHEELRKNYVIEIEFPVASNESAAGAQVGGGNE